MSWLIILGIYLFIRSLVPVDVVDKRTNWLADGVGLIVHFFAVLTGEFWNDGDNCVDLVDNLEEVSLDVGKDGFGFTSLFVVDAPHDEVLANFVNFAFIDVVDDSTERCNKFE